MPSFGYMLHPCDIDPRRWSKCMALAAASMIAQGRHPKTLCCKVQQKRAYRLWRAA